MGTSCFSDFLLCSAPLCFYATLLSYPGINHIFFILLNRNVLSLPRSESSKAHCHFAYVLLFLPFLRSLGLESFFFSFWHRLFSENMIIKNNPIPRSPISFSYILLDHSLTSHLYVISFSRISTLSFTLPLSFASSPALRVEQAWMSSQKPDLQKPLIKEEKKKRRRNVRKERSKICM